MNRLFQKITVVAMLFAGLSLNAQNVGINATGAAPSTGAGLDVNFTNKGFLVPRVSIPNLTLIAPITGAATVSMLVYNTNAATGLGYYYWDGADWIKFFTGNPLVDNGLYYNVGANRVRLGGALVENTTITQGTRQMTFNLNSTGDFNVQDNGTTRFSVQDNGRVTVGGTANATNFNVTGTSYFSNDLYLRDGSVTAGDFLVRIFDSGDDGIIDIYENNARNIRLHGNGVSVFNEQGIASNDFRIESDTKTNMFFMDASLNNIGIGVNPNGNNNTLTVLQPSTAGTAAWFNTTANTNWVTVEVTSASTTQGTGVSGQAFVAVSGTTTNGGAGWAGFFTGDVGCTGTYFGSDRRWKKNIASLEEEDVLSKLMLLEPKKYNFDAENFPGMGFSSDRLHFGFIAQDLEKIFPNIVTSDKAIPDPKSKRIPNTEVKTETGYYMVNYVELIPVLTKAIQEQQILIETQNAKLEALESIVKELQENK